MGFLLHFLFNFLNFKEIQKLFFGNSILESSSGPSMKKVRLKKLQHAHCVPGEIVDIPFRKNFSFLLAFIKNILKSGIFLLKKFL